ILHGKLNNFYKMLDIYDLSELIYGSVELERIKNLPSCMNSNNTMITEGLTLKIEKTKRFLSESSTFFNENNFMDANSIFKNMKYIALGKYMSSLVFEIEHCFSNLYNFYFQKILNQINILNEQISKNKQIQNSKNCSDPINIENVMILENYLENYQGKLYKLHESINNYNKFYKIWEKLTDNEKFYVIYDYVDTEAQYFKNKIIFLFLDHKIYELEKYQNDLLIYEKESKNILRRNRSEEVHKYIPYFSEKYINVFFNGQILVKKSQILAEFLHKYDIEGNIYKNRINKYLIYIDNVLEEINSKIYLKKFFILTEENCKYISEIEIQVLKRFFDKKYHKLSCLIRIKNLSIKSIFIQILNAPLKGFEELNKIYEKNSGIETKFKELKFKNNSSKTSLLLLDIIPLFLVLKDLKKNVINFYKKIRPGWFLSEYYNKWKLRQLLKSFDNYFNFSNLDQESQSIIVREGKNVESFVEYLCKKMRPKS
ncbi:hypothetical protein H311_03079, partial [Anncaliia algerae PRA109]